MFLFIRYKLDQMFWTGGDTFTTGFTCFFVDYCNSIYDMDRIERTCLYTASETKTSKGTSFWSAILHHGCHLAVCNSCIIICLFCFFAGSCTFYKCNFVYAFTGFFAHDRCDLCCYRSTADRTLSDRSFSFCDGCCKTGTSGISTSTTVVTRKFCENRFFFFIYFNCKFLACNSKEDTDEYAGTAYDKCSNQYSCYTHNTVLLLLNDS